MLKVSVVVPVYNSEKFIEKCVESILNQTFDNFEILLIDDGSKDSSFHILEKLAKKDKRIRVIHQENMGVAKTRNKGIKLALGEYITFIDNDDFVEPNYLKNFLEEAEKDNYDIVVGGYKRVNTQKVMFTKKMNQSNWCKFENMAPWGKIIKREFLIKNNIQFFSYSIGEDIIFNMDLYTLSNKVKVIQNYEYNWFFNDKSVSNTLQKTFDKDILILLEQMKKHDRNDETKYFISRYFVWYLLFSGRMATSKEFILEYQKIKMWLVKNHYWAYLSFSNIFRNESSLKNKVIISIFLMLIKTRLISLFSKLYCKGGTRR